MTERNFDMNDVSYLARRGAIRRQPEFHIKAGTWDYVVEGEDVDGDALEIVFSVDKDREVRLITGRRP